MASGTLEEREQRMAYGVRGVTHAYSSVPVLVDIDFEITPGTVHGLVGENGAGKSTLIAVLGGALLPIRGGLYLGEQPVALRSPADAQRIGLAVVHQDVQLFPNLDVARNVYGVSQPLPRTSRSHRIDWERVRQSAGDVLQSLGIDLPVTAKVATLDAVEQRMVEIARAMVRRPRFLILDEPTASLETRAAQRMLDLVSRLRNEGIGVVFVSHRLDEVRRMADKVTVLRDGRLAGRLEANPTEDQMAALMLGDAHAATGMARPKEAAVSSDEIALRISQLTLRGGCAPIDLDIYKGEILGVTGLLGSGADSIVRMLGGAEPFDGELEIFARPYAIREPRDSLRAGIGFIAEDRKTEGLIPDQTVAVNISLSSMRDVATCGWLHGRRLHGRAESFSERLDIRAPSMTAPVSALSGGNQQKVLIARALGSGARILAIQEPTHGVDIGAKAQIHGLLKAFASEGGTVVVSSTDISEILALCDRIAVCRHGSIAAIFSTHETRHGDIVLSGRTDPEHLIDELMDEQGPTDDPEEQ